MSTRFITPLNNFFTLLSPSQTQDLFSLTAQPLIKSFKKEEFFRYFSSLPQQPCFSARGIVSLYERFFKSKNFLRWILERTEGVERDWRASYLNVLGGKGVFERCLGRGEAFGWTDCALIDVLGKLVDAVV